jgi:MSHA biogenesis protein MshE
MARPEKIRIGDLLIQAKLISHEQLSIALELQKKSGRKLGKLLIENGFVTEDQICEGISKQFNIPFINLKSYNLVPEVARRLPEVQARRYRSLVLEDRNRSYLVGMSDPSDLFAYDELARVLKRDIDLAVISETQLLQTIDRVYRRTEEISGLAREVEQDIGDSYVDIGMLSVGVGAEDAPVVRLLQSIFEDAAQIRASDIHIEPQERRLAIRFRIDGMLTPQAESDSKVGPALIQRLKLMAGLDISEKRLPQDGRFNVLVRDKSLDVRVSTMPIPYGESAVMRLLDQSGGLLGLDRLGMPTDIVTRLRGYTQRSYGLVLVTGPTGSGKTTTLYSALAEINRPERKIITVEDPIEYRLPGITQVQVNEKIDLTFSRVLRSTLRHDPDVVLVGEMRDTETAQIGMRAALTGHLVLSTLHTRDAASTPLRLMDMGVPSYMVATSVNAVLAQRLVRAVCDNCKVPAAPSGHELAWLHHHRPDGVPNAQFQRGAGCSQCNGTGFHGRTGVYELLELNGDLIEPANRGETTEFMRRARKRMAGHTMRDHALELALTGRTTLAEVVRVASQIDD